MLFFISPNKRSRRQIFHIVNPTPPTIEEIAEWLKVATGIYRVRVVPQHEFSASAPNALEKSFFRRNKAFQPYMFGEACFDSANTRAFLAGANIDCPLITQEFISRSIQYAIQTKWGKKGADRDTEKENTKWKEQGITKRPVTIVWCQTYERKA
ncbi:hypothetical protein [Candidatus Kuenenia stuttgartiensis]|uniref:hypothetical protein n=1 Tax=Kuenenia stuttgartiensis TaxID=174633 RepID=UPI00146C3E9C|nr:hypothetical protein [Candidatus Kuenenia stuttgartiensis]